MTQANLCDVSRGTLVTVWSMPLIFEGFDPTRTKYLFRYPFSFQCVDESEESVKEGIEIVTQFESVKDTYLRMLSDSIFQGVLKDRHNVSQDTVQGFLSAFMLDLKSLSPKDILRAVAEAEDRYEAGNLQYEF